MTPSKIEKIPEPPTANEVSSRRLADEHDANVWAEEFVTKFHGQHIESSDVETVSQWFARAMVAAVRRRSREVQSQSPHKAGDAGTEPTPLNPITTDAADLRTAVLLAVGAASRSWSEDGVFQDQWAKHVAEDLIDWIEANHRPIPEPEQEQPDTNE